MTEADEVTGLYQQRQTEPIPLSYRRGQNYWRDGSISLWRYRRSTESVAAEDASKSTPP